MKSFYIQLYMANEYYYVQQIISLHSHSLQYVDCQTPLALIDVVAECLNRSVSSPVMSAPLLTCFSPAINITQLPQLWLDKWLVSTGSWSECSSSMTTFVIELLFMSCIQPLRADVFADVETLVMKGACACVWYTGFDPIAAHQH